MAVVGGRLSVAKWVRRFREEGEARLRDRSCHPLCSPRLTSAELVVRVEAHLRQRWTGRRIAREHRHISQPERRVTLPLPGCRHHLVPASRRSKPVVSSPTTGLATRPTASATPAGRSGSSTAAPGPTRHAPTVRRNTLSRQPSENGPTQRLIKT